MPSGGPAAGGGPPIIVAKIDTRGTSTLSDDRLLRGAHFRIYRDNGDGEFDATTDVQVFDGVAETGFLVYKSPGVGSYWVVEVDAPPGYELDGARLLRYPGGDSHESCIQFNGKQKCAQDDDDRGGYLLLVVGDKPAELPPTDTVPRRGGR